MNADPGAPTLALRVAVAAGALLLLLVYEAWFFHRLVWDGLELLPIALLPLGIGSHAWRRFAAILSHREPGTALALFRIGIGSCVLLSIITVAASGAADLMWVDVHDGGYHAVANDSRVLAWLGGPTRAGVHALIGLDLVAATLLTLGLGTRAMAYVTLFGFSLLIGLNPIAGGSYDNLVENALWLLVLAPCTRTLSFDAKVRTGSFFDPTPVSAWPRYLVIFQLVLCYFTTGLQKVSAHWMPGGSFDALYYIFLMPAWQRFDMSWVAWFYPLTQVGTAVTWLWECGSPLLLLAFWYRGTRTWPGRLRALMNAWDFRTLFVVVGVIMHAALLVFMNVGPFSPVTLSYYFCLYHPDEYAAFYRRLRYSVTRMLDWDAGSKPLPSRAG